MLQVSNILCVTQWHKLTFVVFNSTLHKALFNEEMHFPTNVSPILSIISYQVKTSGHEGSFLKS